VRVVVVGAKTGESGESPSDRSATRAAPCPWWLNVRTQTRRYNTYREILDSSPESILAYRPTEKLIADRGGEDQLR
jgi:hypothetical protein